MIPYVWNRKFYDTIMSTWGRRCDVINFIADSIVLDDSAGGEVKGDQIIQSSPAKGGKLDNGKNFDPLMGYKNYTDFPKGTFPDNVHFVNMTRPWTGCKDTKTGQGKLCRHIN